MMSKKKTNWLIVTLLFTLFAFGNFIHLGKYAGASYNWKCSKCGADLSLQPSDFGNPKLVVNHDPNCKHQWHEIYHSPKAVIWKPWTWISYVVGSNLPPPNEIYEEALGSSGVTPSTDQFLVPSE